jgi:hypothetical protein
MLGPPLLRIAKRPSDAAVGPLRPDGSVATPWSTTRMVWWVAVLLGAMLLLTLL